MTETPFRRLALDFPETREHAHGGHPDFRVAGKVFATLAYPAKGWGMVKLTLDQHAMFVRAQPEAFVPVKGGWGKRGATNVRLAKAKTAAVHGALVAAWLNTAPEAARPRARTEPRRLSGPTWHPAARLRCATTGSAPIGRAGDGARNRGAPIA